MIQVQGYYLMACVIWLGINVETAEKPCEICKWYSAKELSVTKMDWFLTDLIFILIKFFNAFECVWPFCGVGA